MISVSTIPTRAGQGARPFAKEKQLQRALHRFPASCRAAVLRAAQDDSRLADLALSFPAMLFVIAVPHKGRDATALRNAVCEGQSLKTLAAMAGLPLWLRQLPPEAFTQQITNVPQHPVFARQIVNHIPRKAALTGRWLENVMLACRFSDEAFAVWVARECGDDKYFRHNSHALLLWAWFSLRPHLKGASFAKRKWTPAIKRKAARSAGFDWLEALRLHITIEQAVLKPLWIETRSTDGIDFVPLLTAADIQDEGVRMGNCVATYGLDIANDRERLWSLRKDGASLATLTVGPDEDLGLLRITQIKAAKNEKVSRELALTAKRWFTSTNTDAIEVAPVEWQNCVENVPEWKRIFRPYWLEKRFIPDWLPLVPKRGTLGGL